MDDEVTIDEDVLSVEEDDTLSVDDNSEKLSSSNTVTNSTFYSYFDEYGDLLDNVTADELVFEGDFTGVGVNMITINKTITLTGNNATFTNVEFGLYANNTVLTGFKLYMDNSSNSLISVADATNVTISDNIIDFKDFEGFNSFAIFAYDVDALNIKNNNITFVGTNGTVVNNAVRVYGDEKNSTNIVVEGNIFNITMPSAQVGYDAYYNSISYCDGVVFLTCENVTFKGNDITLNYNNVSGYYDTIHVLVFGNSNYAYDEEYEVYYPNVCQNVVIEDNNITATGYTYIYGISVAAEDFEITNNILYMYSDSHYAAALDIEGPSADGDVSDNYICVMAPNLSFGVYSYSYMGAIEDITYYNNTIIAYAYGACGMEIVADDIGIYNNLIILTGNYTTGIVGDIDFGTISQNIINAEGTNIGNASTGDGYVHAESTGICVNGDIDIYGNNITSTAIGVNLNDYGSAGDICLESNNIIIYATGTTRNYAVYVDGIDSFEAWDNNITFYGKTNGSFVTNALYVANIDEVEIYDNVFDIFIPSMDIVWSEVPSGSGNWVSTVLSEGIVFDTCDNLTFKNNNVTAQFNNVSGWYDTIYVLDVIDSDDVEISKNNITGVGYSYIYGIVLSGIDFGIYYNNIDLISYYQTNGIDIEGPAYGIIWGNNISAVADYNSYPIYTAMSNGNVSVGILYNTINASAYYVVGMEIAGNLTAIISNDIYVEGNHTIGIGLKVNQSYIAHNTIMSKASNEGDEYVWDAMGTDTTGIIILAGDFNIMDNDIETTGDYAIIAGDNNGNITDNALLSNNGEGNNAIIGVGDINVSGNPSTSNKYLKVVLFANEFTKVYGSSDQFTAKILDENGQPVGNKTIKLIIDGVVYTNTSDYDGNIAFDIDLDADEYAATLKFDGDSDYSYKSILTYITVTAKPTAITAASTSVLLTAVKSGSNYNIVLKDDSGNVLANKTVTITFNGKTANATTDSNGAISYKLAATKAGSYPMTISFAGDTNYAASTATPTIKITKEATKLTAKKKTFKAKKKTKKYAVTLKDSKGKAIKKVKVTIKIGKKTFKAKTNAKGKATFKIKKVTKKGKYTSKVKFAGNTYYKASTKSVKITLK